MPAGPYNRATASGFGDRFGKFITHPAVQGTAAIAPAVLAVAPALLGSMQAPPPPPMPPPRPAPQPQQRRDGEDDQGNGPRPPHQQMTRMAALSKVANPLAALSLGARAMNAIGTASQVANVVGTGAQVASMMKKPKPPPSTAGPGGSENGSGGNKLSSVQAPTMPAAPKPTARPKRKPDLPAPGASNAFTAKAAPPKSPGMSGLAKAASFGGVLKAKAHDFGVGAGNELAAGLNTFLTPTTARDPRTMHAVDDSTPLR